MRGDDGDDQLNGDEGRDQLFGGPAPTGSRATMATTFWRDRPRTTSLMVVKGQTASAEAMAPTACRAGNMTTSCWVTTATMS